MQVFYSLLNYSSTRIFLFLLLATVFFYIIKAFRFKYGDSLLKNILYVGVLHVILCFFETFTHYKLLTATQLLVIEQLELPHILLLDRCFRYLLQLLL